MQIRQRETLSHQRAIIHEVCLSSAQWDILVVFASNVTVCTGATGALLAPVKRSSWALNFFWRGALSFRVRAKVDGSLVQQLVAKVLQFKYLKNNIKNSWKGSRARKIRTSNQVRAWVLFWIKADIKSDTCSSYLLYICYFFPWVRKKWWKRQKDTWKNSLRQVFFRSNITKAR